MARLAEVVRIAQASGYADAERAFKDHGDRLLMPESIILTRLLWKLQRSGFGTLAEADAYAQGIQQWLDEVHERQREDTQAYLASLHAKREAEHG